MGRLAENDKLNCPWFLEQQLTTTSLTLLSLVSFPFSKCLQTANKSLCILARRLSKEAAAEDSRSLFSFSLTFFMALQFSSRSFLNTKEDCLYLFSQTFRRYYKVQRSTSRNEWAFICCFWFLIFQKEWKTSYQVKSILILAWTWRTQITRVQYRLVLLWKFEEKNVLRWNTKLI